MKFSIFRTMILALGATGALWAQEPQNLDFSLLVGTTSGGTNVVVGTGGIKTSTGVGFSMNMGHQMKRFDHVNLWWEMPFTLVGRSSTSLGAGWSASNSTEMYWTPGVRVQAQASDRVMLFGAVGGGMAVSSDNGGWLLKDGVKIGTQSATGAALMLGAGVDYRIVRRLSFRMEFRDYLGVVGIGNVSGRNRALFLGGLALHW